MFYPIYEVLSLFGIVFLIITVADFYSGLLHWFLDTYGNPQWKFVGKLLVAPALKHHECPRDLVKPSYWQRNKVRYLFALILCSIAYIIGTDVWMIIIFFIFASHTSEFHAISHRSEKENGKFITFLQKLRLIQTKRHHAWHHKAPHECNYCVITNWLNPILDGIQLWRRMEFLLLLLFNVRVLRGTVVQKID